jgi:hypothetical protein
LREALRDPLRALRDPLRLALREAFRFLRRRVVRLRLAPPLVLLLLIRLPLLDELLFVLVLLALLVIGILPGKVPLGRV